MWWLLSTVHAHFYINFLDLSRVLYRLKCCGILEFYRSQFIVSVYEIVNEKNSIVTVPLVFPYLTPFTNILLALQSHCQSQEFLQDFDLGTTCKWLAVFFCINPSYFWRALDVFRPVFLKPALVFDSIFRPARSMQ
jgi:hypothetical protein